MHILDTWSLKIGTTGAVFLFVAAVIFGLV
jgi:hypothetical protein